MKALEVNNIVKSYQHFNALDGLSFSIQKGEVYGLLGPNGAGKSTLLRCLLTLIKYDSGSIKIFDKELLHHRKTILQNVGYLIEKPDFYGYLSANKNLEIMGAYSGKNISAKRIAAVIEQVGLKGREKDKVKTYSHGMKQRLGLAQVILHNPDLIILDEPNTGLDPSGIVDLRNFINQLKAEGKTVLLSSHVLNEIELTADSMIILNKGKALVSGSVQELLDDKELHVKIEVNNMEDAINILSHTNFSNHLKTISANVLELTMQKKDIAGINKLLVEKGIDILSLNYKKPLEELYMNLTKTNIHA